MEPLGIGRIKQVFPRKSLPAPETFSTSGALLQHRRYL